MAHAVGLLREMVTTTSPVTEPIETPRRRTATNLCSSMVAMLPSVISDDGLETLVHHQYKSGHWSILDHALNGWWECVVKQMPMWLAPNLITLIGSIWYLASVPVGLQYSETCTETDEISFLPLANLFIAVALFAYQTLDAIDGKQARRTKSSSPLGQLFDHGCDALTTCAVAWNGLFAFGLGVSSESFMVFSVLLLAFFLGQWEEYHTHVLSTNVRGIGVTEGQCFLILFHVACAFVPCGFWAVQRTIFQLPPSAALPGGMIIRSSLRIIFAYTAVAAMGFVALAFVCRVIVRHGHYKSIGHLLGPAAVTATGMLLFVDPSRSWFGPVVHAGDAQSGVLPLADVHPGLLFLCFSLSITYMSTQIIVYSMAHDAFPQLQWSALAFPLVAVIAYLPASRQYSSLALEVYLGLLVAIYAYFVVVAMNQITTRLDIHAFKIKHHASHHANDDAMPAPVAQVPLAPQPAAAAAKKRVRPTTPLVAKPAAPSRSHSSSAGRSRSKDARRR